MQVAHAAADLEHACARQARLLDAGEKRALRALEPTAFIAPPLAPRHAREKASSITVVHAAAHEQDWLLLTDFFLSITLLLNLLVAQLIAVFLHPLVHVLY